MCVCQHAACTCTILTRKKKITHRMIKCISFLGAPKVLSWFCQFVFNFFFARRHSLMWNISQGCTTGMPAPMLAPPSATSAVTASQGSLLMASPVKVGAHFLCLHFAFCRLYLSQLCICESLFNYGCHILLMPPICLLILRSLFIPGKRERFFFVSVLICSCRPQMI